MDFSWQALVAVGIPVAEKVLRTVLVYTFLLIGLRLFGKRELGQLNPLDFIVLLLLSNTVQNAIIGNDNSLMGGLLGAGVLFVVNDLLVRLSFRWPRLRRTIEGHPETLVRDGRVVRRALDRNQITLEDLVTAARRQGINELHAVESARLELNGSLSFTLLEPGSETKFQHEVLARLAAIEQKLGVA